MSSENSNSAPWLNSNYVKAILKSFEGHEEFKLNDFNVGTGSNAGENFAGVISRIEINYTIDGVKKSIKFIVKESPSAGAIAELLETMNTFEGESIVYQHILRACESLLGGFKMAPRLIYADKNALVLEDLLSLNFELANRKERFDIKRAKLVLEKLAKFHAITVTLKKSKPEAFENHLFSPYASEEMTPLSFFLSASLQETIETIRNDSELQIYLPLLEDFDIVDEERKIFSRDDANDRFHVFNHGDLWINNIFFKNDDAKCPIDVLFVDYQECFFGSPGIDFNHFLYTSCNYDVHENHVDELIAFYHEHLIASLKQLKYSNIPSLDDIKYEIDNKGKQGLIALCSAVPAQMIENPEHANPEYFLADTEEAQAVRRVVYGNPKYVELLKKLLPLIIKRGILVGQAESHF